MYDTKPVEEEVSKGEDVEVEASEGTDELPPKKVEGTKEWFQSQLDKTQKQLAEREAAWREKEQQFTSQFAELQKAIETVKNPPKEEMAPPNPKDFDMSDPTEKLDYLEKITEYRDRVYQSKLSEIEALKAEREAEKQQRQQAQELEMRKAHYISKLQQRGLSPEEAYKGFEKMTTFKDEEEYLDAAAQFIKHQLGISYKAPTPEKKSNPLKDGAPPPPSSGGADQIDPSDYTKIKDTSKLYKTTKL